MAEDESYRDPTNILRKLKRHEATEKEMKANEVRLDTLVQVNRRRLVLWTLSGSLSHIFGFSQERR